MYPSRKGSSVTIISGASEKRHLQSSPLKELFGWYRSSSLARERPAPIDQRIPKKWDALSLSV